MSARGSVRATAATWCSMSSIVTWSVSSYPSTTLATESPTRRTSTPAALAIRADGASYAVTITTGVPRPLKAATAGAVTRRVRTGAVGAGVSAMTCLRCPGHTRLPATRGTVARLHGVTATVELVPLEVVPVALDAHLDHVPRELLARRGELGQLRGGLDAAPVGAAQAVAVDVRDEHEARATAHGTVAVEPLSQVAGGPEQLGLSVAHVEPGPLAGAQVAQHCPP